MALEAQKEKNSFAMQINNKKKKKIENPNKVIQNLYPEIS